MMVSTVSSESKGMVHRSEPVRRLIQLAHGASLSAKPAARESKYAREANQQCTLLRQINFLAKQIIRRQSNIGLEVKLSPGGASFDTFTGPQYSVSNNFL